MVAPFEIIELSSTLPVSAEEAFAWHERPGAFERLTPPWERVTVVDRPPELAEGARVVVSGHTNLRPGALVRVSPTDLTELGTPTP